MCTSSTGCGFSLRSGFPGDVSLVSLSPSSLTVMEVICVGFVKRSCTLPVTISRLVYWPGGLSSTKFKYISVSRCRKSGHVAAADMVAHRWALNLSMRSWVYFRILCFVCEGKREATSVRRLMEATGMTKCIATTKRSLRSQWALLNFTLDCPSKYAHDGEDNA